MPTEIHGAEPVHPAVIGSGSMGSSHARVAAGSNGIELAAVYDPDREGSKSRNPSPRTARRRSTWSTLTLEVPFLRHRGEPLARELTHCADCVRPRSRPRVSSADGIRALELALHVAAAENR
jgi:predicted dehydrogenase